MQAFKAGQANTIYADMVAKLDGEPITSGTVTFYLLALSGSNNGKWWSAATATWSATEVSAGAGTYKSKQKWLCSIAAGAWASGVRYQLDAHESGSLNIPYSEQVTDILTSATGPIAFPYTVTNSVTGLPISEVRVWVTTDEAGNNVIRNEYTTSLGVATFYLDAGTYYFWRSKSGYRFTNPDTEVVA